MKDLILVISPSEEWSNSLVALASSCRHIELLVERDLRAALENAAKSKSRGHALKSIFVSVDTRVGCSAITKVKEAFKDVRVIATSQSSDWSTIRSAFRLGADDFEWESSADNAKAEFAKKYFGVRC